MGKKTSVYLTEELENKLNLNRFRGLSEAIHCAVDRYQEIIGTERRKVEAMFSEGEWNTMRNACNGTVWVPAGIIRGGVLANIEDSLDEEIEAYGADRRELEEKLRGLSVIQQFALVELIEEWWAKQ